MKRVASLYLPEWSLDRLRRAGRIPKATTQTTSKRSEPRADGKSGDAGETLGRIAAAERARTCSVPNTPDGRPGAHWAREEARAADLSRAHRGSNDGWWPGAKWAKGELAAEIERLPLHQRPSMRELGRRSEPAGHPFKAMPPDEAGATAALARWRNAPAIAYPGEGPHPPREKGAPYPGEGRFFMTGRMTGDVVGRTCAEDPAAPPDPGPGRPIAGPPVVTALRVDGRDVVHAACPAARALGLAPGVWLTQARATVPGLLVLPADPEGDRAALRRLAVALARRWAPTVAVSGDDGLFIDLTGVSHLHGGEANFRHRLQNLLNRLGYCNHIAISDTPGSAWAFARHLRQHPAAIFPPAAHVDALEPLPVAALRLEPPHVELLRRLGVDTVGELTRLPRAPLARRFGGALVRRLDQATGRAPEPLEPVLPPEHVFVRQVFAEPIATPEPIENWLGLLLERLATALAEAGLGARSVLLAAERLDRRDQRLRIGVARATRDPAHLLRLFRRRIEEIEPGFGIEALTLHVLRAEPLGAEALAPALADEAVPDLAPLVDAIANRADGLAPWRMTPVESDVPERTTAVIPALDPPEREARPLRQDDVRQLAVAEDDHPWHARWPRPVRLLPRPEPVEHVLAELPDQPPRRFTWRGVTHRVVRADGPERITGEWWRRSAERDAVRDYFHLEDEVGRRFWLFRRGDGVRPETGDLSWHLHGMYG